MALGEHSALTEFGGWLFRRRTWLPLPIIVALVLIPPNRLPSPFLRWSGAVIVGAGELLRFWAVRHIGVISRTRSERLGPLVSTGPFGRIRNPLYVGNLALWVGFTVSSGVLWLLPVVVLLLVIEYRAIVRWEEGLLQARLGEAYRSYATEVPRWVPRKGQSAVGSRQSAVNSQQSAVNSRQSEVGSRQSAVNSQQSAVNSQQSAVDSQQSAVDSQQSAVDSQQSAVDSQQSAVVSWRQTLFSERGTLLAIAFGYLLLWLKSWLAT